jgi:hypothetical protein
MFKKFLSLSAIIFLLVSCDTNKNLSEFSKDVIINKLSSYQIKEESDVSYTYDGGKKKTTLAFKTDFTFEYTYEQTYQGSRKTFVYVTGNVNFIGEVENVMDKGTEMLKQKLELIGKNRDFEQVEFNATIVQFKNSKGYKNKLFFSGESKTYNMRENSSSSNLKLPSENFSL